jgi:hypothetical protein
LYYDFCKYFSNVVEPHHVGAAPGGADDRDPAPMAYVYCTVQCKTDAATDFLQHYFFLYVCLKMYIPLKEGIIGFYCIN